MDSRLINTNFINKWFRMHRNFVIFLKCHNLLSQILRNLNFSQCIMKTYFSKQWKCSSRSTTRKCNFLLSTRYFSEGFINTNTKCQTPFLGMTSCYLLQYQLYDVSCQLSYPKPCEISQISQSFLAVFTTSMQIISL